MVTSKWLSYKMWIHQKRNHILGNNFNRFYQWTHGNTYQICFLPWRNNNWLFKECKIFAFSAMPRIKVLQNINHYYPWMIFLIYIMSSTYCLNYWLSNFLYWALIVPLICWKDPTRDKGVWVKDLFHFSTCKIYAIELQYKIWIEDQFHSY